MFGRHFFRLLKAVEGKLVLLQPAVISTCLVGDLPRRHKTSQKLRDLTLENKWEEIADMREERGNAFGVVMHEKIFVAGGSHRERPSVLQTREVYYMSTNEWHLTDPYRKLDCFS